MNPSRKICCYTGKYFSRILNSSRLGLSQNQKINQTENSTRSFITKSSKTESTEAPQDEVIDSENSSPYTEEEIMRIRNKSRLNGRHYEIQHDYVTPFEGELYRDGLPLFNQRKYYGKGGKASGFDAYICWPSKEEIEYQQEYEKVLNPKPIKEMIQDAKAVKIDKHNIMMTKQERIKGNMMNLSKWKEEFRAKIAKKENVAREVEEVRQRRLDEVRQIFGYNISPTDPKFITALEQKEAEELKTKKAVKKIEKQRKAIEIAKKEVITEAARVAATTEVNEGIYGTPIVSVKGAIEIPEIKSDPNNKNNK